jgi:hypothetical protein
MTLDCPSETNETRRKEVTYFSSAERKEVAIANSVSDKTILQEWREK